MANQTRLLELALRGLEAERGQIDNEIADIRSQLGGKKPALSPVAPAVRPASQRRRGGLSAAGRKKISEMMKARWAARRGGMQATSNAPARSAAKSTAKKRGLTAAGRKALSEAAKRRWAAFRKAKAK